VQHHVHARQGGGGVVHLLPVERQVQAGAALGLVVRLEQQRARSTGRVTNALACIPGGAQFDHLRHHARDFGRGIELALAFAGLGGEVAHQVFIRIAQQVVALGAVAAKVQPFEDAYQPGQPVHHFLALAELFLVVEVGHIDGAFEGVVGVGQAAHQFVDLVADLLVVLERDHVGKAAAGRHIDQRMRVARIFVRDVFDEQQHQHVILVLAGVHAATQFIARLPQGGIEFGFF